MPHPIIFNIYDHKKKLRAALAFGPGGVPEFSSESDPSIIKTIRDIFKKGIKQFRDMHDPRSHSFTTIAGPIAPSDPFYPLAVKNVLEGEGYRVLIRDKKVEDEIRELLQDVPDDNSDKQDIISRLTEMSYLEQTALLGSLQTINRGNS